MLPNHWSVRPAVPTPRIVCVILMALFVPAACCEIAPFLCAPIPTSLESDIVWFTSGLFAGTPAGQITVTTEGVLQTTGDLYPLTTRALTTEEMARLLTLLRDWDRIGTEPAASACADCPEDSITYAGRSVYWIAWDPVPQPLSALSGFLSGLPGA